MLNLLYQSFHHSRFKRYIAIPMFLGLLLLIPTIISAEDKEDTKAVPHFQKREEFFSKGMYKEAIEEFKKALAENPVDLQTNKKLGLSYLNIGDITSAIAQLTATLLIEPDDTETLMALGGAYSLNKQFDESIRLYKRAVTIDPPNVWFRYKLVEVLSWVKRYDESIQEYKKILDLEPENNGVRINLGEVYAWKAKEEEKPELFDEAIMELNRVIHNEPKNALAYKKLGWVYLEKQDLRKASKILETAFNLNPEDHETKMLLALSYGWRGKYNEAIRIYNDILAKNPNDIGGLYMLGEVLSWAKRYDKSIASYEKTLKLEPTNLGAKIGIARAHSLKWNYIKASEIYNEILAEDTKNTGALLGLAEMERWQWNWRASVNKYKNVLEFDPANKVAKEGLKEIGLITSPSLQANSGYFADSDDFERTWGGGSFQFRPFEKTSLSAGFMRWRFHQKGVPTVYRNDYSFKIRQHFSNFLDGEIGYTANDYSKGGTEHSISLSGILNLKEKANLYLSYTYNAPIVDSILTITDDFSANIYGLGIDYRFFEKWSFQGGFSISDYSDDNKRLSRDAQLAYHLLEVPRIDLRFKYAFLDLDKQSPLYWTPTNYETYSFIADLEQKITKKISFGLNGTGTYFSEGGKWGYGAKGYLNLGLTDSLNVLLSASYFNAKTKDPWLGKAFELRVIYVF